MRKEGGADEKAKMEVMKEALMEARTEVLMEGVVSRARGMVGQFNAQGLSNTV